MSGRLEAKVALITGASRGQGAAEARRFVAEGARVLVTDILDEQGRALADELGAAAAYRSLDVTDPDQWDAAVAAAVECFGALHVLVNNAGTGIVAPLDGLDLEEHRKILDVNLNGVYLGMRAAKAALAATGNASIVNTSSIDGLVGVLGMTSYSASKFAVTGLTRSAAIELGPLGIRVNSIHPGVIRSPMVEDAPEEIRARLDRLMARQPIKRMGEPDEIAALALFLASDEASYITGSQIVIDGGHLAGPWREAIEDAPGDPLS
ncbi:MAG: 3-alpha-hydroxysteroid dehydrogenase [Deltaproteobacteria bacterium]|jgi:3alpha(or 20beta)-hydroxysteroid dehydrogenase|nr:3-alpha-hydroxysteroid dehydrogenase [Deltaproteobacteria bacterium]